MYEFIRIEKIMTNLKIKVTSSGLLDLKNELNRFFRDSKCKEVIYTQNTDKPFFGMCVLPASIKDTTIFDIYNGEFKRFDEYYVEVDSKLFDSLLGFTTKELVAILLHEVGHVVNNVAVSKNISDNLHYYIGKTGVTIDYDKCLEANPLMNLAIRRTIRKVTSIFEKNREEYVADDFVVKCGYGQALNSAFEKIIKNRGSLGGGDGKFIVLLWSLSVYRDMRLRKRNIISQLEDGKKVEGSKLFQRFYDTTIQSLNRVPNSYGRESESVNEAIKLVNNSSFIKKLKYSSLKSLEDDYYEFNIKINSIEDNVEAMDVLRSINMRIGLVSEYLDQESPNLTQSEMDKLNTLANKYKGLRDDLVKKGSFDKSVYGLFVKYPNEVSGRGNRVY